MMIDDDDLKYDGQCPKSMHILAILMKLFEYSVLLTTALRCFYEILSGPRADELLHLSIALVNSSFEKRAMLTTVLIEVHPKHLC